MTENQNQWRAAYDDDAACWRVAREEDGELVYGGQVGIEGRPYRCCCEANATALARAMNTVAHS